MLADGLFAEGPAWCDRPVLGETIGIFASGQAGRGCHWSVAWLGWTLDTPHAAALLRLRHPHLLFLRVLRERRGMGRPSAAPRREHDRHRARRLRHGAAGKRRYLRRRRLRLDRRRARDRRRRGLGGPLALS